MLRHLLITLAFLLCSCLSYTTVQADAPGNEGFQRGINLSHWYAQIFMHVDTLQHLQTHVTDEDLALIKSIGLDHVRFPVNPDVLQAEVYDGWAEYHKAVDRALRHDLNVIVDVHPQGDYKEALRDDPAAQEAFITFWQKLAGLFADSDPACVRFELLNEPVLPIEKWGPLQARVLAAVREIVPEHTVVLTGGKWSGVSQLVEMEPVDDPNVVYNIHFYEPHQFTHQAATWGTEHWREMKGLPYPASEQGVQDALSKTDNPAAINDITRYGQSGWDGEKVHEEIVRAAQWAEAHGGLTLSCNEFGVYMKAVNPAHRAAWIHDVRDSLESQHIGWSMWDYAGGFGLTRDGKQIDAIVEALLPRGRYR